MNFCASLSTSVLFRIYLCSYGHGDEDDGAVASPENKPRILLMGLRRYMCLCVICTVTVCTSYNMGSTRGIRHCTISLIDVI